jgi:ubiquinone/menaquinone biosynthesis C-methylase UbiE
MLGSSRNGPVDRYKASSYRAYNREMPERYDRSFWMTFCQMSLLDHLVVEKLRPDIASLRILDVGCATGRSLSALAGAGATRLSGVDLAPRILDVARKKLTGQGVDAELHQADAEDALPWPAESFDVVTLIGVLHHFYHPLAALREIHRTLRASGRLLVIDPCFFFPVRHILNACFRVAPHAGDYRFYSWHEATRLLEQAGFRCSEGQRAGLWSYLLVERKVSVQQRAA